MSKKITVSLMNAPSKKDIINILYIAFRQCSSSKNLEELKKEANSCSESHKCSFINQWIDSGHTSPLGHIKFTFHVDGINRACSHQLVRHQVGTVYSHQSLRYTSPSVEDESWVSIPKKIEIDPELYSEYKKAISKSARAYEALRKKLPLSGSRELARKVLPLCTTSNMVVSMNLRTMLNFFGERMCSHAEDDIRNLATQMANIVKDHIGGYLLKSKLAPKCIQIGACLEEKSCGLRPKLSEALSVYYQEQNKD